MISLPTRGRGRLTRGQQRLHDQQVDVFVQQLLEIRSRLDFEVGTRGWCYLLENEGVIGKDEFDRMETLIGDWRKSGQLPLDFCANDEKRAPVNLEDLDIQSPEVYARDRAEGVAMCWRWYEPISFWEFQDHYIEMAVEKNDLRTLFENVCAEYHIPIWNAGGWSDINSRAHLMERFQEHDLEGRHCILLYCGDFDPAGLHISDTIRKNLFDLEDAVGWSPDESQLTIERFGLNYDFITANNITWIEGLKTGGGGDLADPAHKDHFKPYVQTYLKLYCGLGDESYGKDDLLPASCYPRKVEANALVARHEAGRQLCREAIEKYIDQGGIAEYEEKLHEERQKVRTILPVIIREMLDGGQ